MPQIFGPSANSVARATILGGLLLVAGALTGLALVQRGSLVTGVGVVQAQPVMFSHKHHVADDGIDCRYCHTSVEDAPFAGPGTGSGARRRGGSAPRAPDLSGSAMRR